MSNALRSDVLIVGAGASGLYAALLLASMNVSVCIIDSKPSPVLNSNITDESSSLLISPHTLQYLQAHQLIEPLMENGMRHWRFQTYINQGKGTNATSVERQSYRVWERKGSQFNWALSCDAAHLEDVLRTTLHTRHHIQVEYRHELVNLQDMMTSHGATATDESIDYPIVASIKDLATGRLSCHRSRIVLGADGVNSFVRQKIGCKQRNGGKSATFYTLKVSAEGNFPGMRALSVVTKENNAAMLIGHRKHLIITMEEHSDWSQFSLLDHDDLLLQSIETHIKSILQPYDIKFSKVHSYKRWQANDPTTDIFSLHRRYFLVGSAAQRLSPHDILSVNLAFDQVHNLCWKLNLFLKRYASPHILDTYDIEARSHVRDYMTVSNAMLALITCNDYKEEKDGDDDRNSIASTATQRMKRSSSWFIGGAPYPSSSISNSLTIAYNSKLKPYTAQRLASQIIKPKGSRSSTSSSMSDPASSTISITNSSNESMLSRSRSLTGLNGKHRSLPMAEMNNLENGSTWLFRKPVFRNKTKVKTRGYQHYDQDSVVVAPHVDRWRFIKANHYDILDRITADRTTPGCFTILVFCSAITECQHALQQLKQYLDLPSSIMQYDIHPSQHRQQEQQQSQSFVRPLSSSSSTESTMSSPRSSSSIMSAGNRLSRFFSSWSSTSSHSTVSVPSLSSNSTTCTSSNMPSSLFSFVYITSSTRQEVADFLSITPTTILRHMFPHGLERLYLDHDNQAHSSYNVNEPTLVIVRPDDYMGARIRLPCQLPGLGRYFERFMVPPVDMDSAAADVAADFYF
ncbi:FAD/NAD(P)-binding domain-containing protein [Lichtheimia hyalospora FSU 10163]|nr:FAD/NAD(P)-binding domain-containing protein [Lichtheimia hyalospora FSU 10163]